MRAGGVEMPRDDTILCSMGPWLEGSRIRPYKATHSGYTTEHTAALYTNVQQLIKVVVGAGASGGGGSHEIVRLDIIYCSVFTPLIQSDLL